MFKILKNAECKARWNDLATLQGKYFNNPDWEYVLDHYVETYSHPYFVMNLVEDEGKINGFIDFSITTKTAMEDLCNGRRKEHDVGFYPQGGSEEAYLFFMTLLVENKRSTTHLIKSSFNEVEKILRAWKINVTHVYTMAYTKVSERLMRKHGFKQVGLYEGHYPVMAMKVTDNPYLKVFIPHVAGDTHPPFGR